MKFDPLSAQGYGFSDTLGVASCTPLAKSLSPSKPPPPHPTPNPGENYYPTLTPPQFRGLSVGVLCQYPNPTRICSRRLMQGSKKRSFHRTYPFKLLFSGDCQRLFRPSHRGSYQPRPTDGCPYLDNQWLHHSRFSNRAESGGEIGSQKPVRQSL